MQFLVEAVTLSIFGGIAGIAIGLGLAYTAVGFLNVPFVPSPTIIAVAFLFSAAIGYLGMSLAVRANLRVAAAADKPAGKE